MRGARAKAVGDVQTFTIVRVPPRLDMGGDEQTPLIKLGPGRQAAEHAVMVAVAKHVSREATLAYACGCDEKPLSDGWGDAAHNTPSRAPARPG